MQLNNADTVVNGKISSIETIPVYEEPTKLSEIAEKDGVDEHYFIPEDKMEKWTYESSLNRSTYIIEYLKTKKLRQLTPVGCECVNGFLDNRTKNRYVREAETLYDGKRTCDTANRTNSKRIEETVL